MVAQLLLFYLFSQTVYGVFIADPPLLKPPILTLQSVPGICLGRDFEYLVRV